MRGDGGGGRDEDEDDEEEEEEEQEEEEEEEEEGVDDEACPVCGGFPLFKIRWMRSAFRSSVGTLRSTQSSRSSTTFSWRREEGY